jgi:hypothetical protein
MYEIMLRFAVVQLAGLEMQRGIAEFMMKMNFAIQALVDQTQNVVLTLGVPFVPVKVHTLEIH